MFERRESSPSKEAFGKLFNLGF